ncbi:MAG: prepilin-type N-terminal cleavage/methylation domain-containing protein [Patescibacteria group bacterium]
MKKTSPINKHLGFTLIEVLVVITLLGILMGVVLVVIDVPSQRIRAKQGVAKASISKSCSAFTACLSSSLTGATTDCDTWAKIGAITPTQPTGYTYTTTVTGPSVSGDTCTIACDVNGNVSVTGAGCKVQ